jgi:hypothetical protein
VSQVARRHFITFYSPGTLFSETTSKPIDDWDTRKAVAMAADITERHGSTPYGFRFETRACAPDTDDGAGGTIHGAQKVMGASPMHFINGQVETLAQVKARNTGGEDILISNMEGNGWDRVITTRNGYKSTQPFTDGAVNVDVDGNVLEVA